MVRDFDQEGAYHRWRDSHPEAADTLPTVRTVRGFHVYVRGQADKTKKYDDGELRAGGAYVLAPSSLHPAGITYTWTSPFRGDEIPTVDLAAVGFLQDYPCNIEAEKRRSVSNFYASMLHTDGVPEAISKCIPSQVGHRHKCLFRLARELKAISGLAELKAKELKRPFESAAITLTEEVADNLDGILCYVSESGCIQELGTAGESPTDGCSCVVCEARRIRARYLRPLQAVQRRRGGLHPPAEKHLEMGAPVT